MCRKMDTFYPVYRKLGVTWLVALAALVTAVLAGRLAVRNMFLENNDNYDDEENTSL